MSQIDKIIYLPLLNWFWVLFLILYLLVFMNFLGAFFHVYRVRLLLFQELLVECWYDIAFIESYWYVSIKNEKNIKFICFRR